MTGLYEHGTRLCGSYESIPPHTSKQDGQLNFTHCTALPGIKSVFNSMTKQEHHMVIRLLGLAG